MNDALLPDITVAAEDLAILSRVVAKAVEQGQYAAATLLANELNRARILPAAMVPSDCLVLGVAARYLEERSGTIHDVIIVPARAHPSSGAVSVLSYRGTALLGLTVGQRIGLPGPHQAHRVLRLLEVKS